MAARLLIGLLEVAAGITPVLAVLLLLAPGPGRRYTPRLRGLVWLAVVVRLLIPLGYAPADTPFRLDLTAAVSAGSGRTGDTREADKAVEAEALAALAQTEEQEPGGVPVITVDPATLRLADPAVPLRWVTLLGGMWLAGAAGYGLFLLLGHLRAVRALRRWSTPVLDRRSLAVLELVAEEYGVRQPVRLYRSDRVGGPMLVGLWRPRIILPESGCGERNLALVLSHELCHLRRRDLWRKLLFLLVGVLYWFHPLVHLLRRQAEWDIEMACDQEVLADANPLLRREYGFAVLAALEGMSGRTIPLSTRFHGGRRQMLRRFRGMVDPAPKRRGGVLLALVLAAVLLCGALVSCAPAESAPPDDDAERPNVVVEPPPDDPDAYRQMAADMQAELAAIAAGIDWDKAPYEGGEMLWPAPGLYTVTSPYGARYGGSDFHTGTDISGEEPYGSEVIAAADGSVIHVNTDYSPGRGYGIYLIIDHGGGVSTLYAQLSGVEVAVGDSVRGGDVVGRVGSTGFSTGPHLHFEIRIDGVHTDPMNYLTQEGGEQPGPSETGFVLPIDGAATAFELATDSEGGVWAMAERETAVRASRAGTVTGVLRGDSPLEYQVTIDHGDGFRSVYAHAGTTQVAVGDEVETGQEIGRTGAVADDGRHAVYFSLWYSERAMTAIDYIGGGTTELL